MSQTESKVVALSGGIGGAKLALGLSTIVSPKDLTIVANTGDDFEHAGFTICPDIDTLIYTLAGVSNMETGWGRADETWSFMEALRANDPEQAWFLLGDKDLETHRHRSKALQSGRTLTEVTAELVEKFGVHSAILPMSDDPIRTHVLAKTDDERNWLAFQEYFVRERCEPQICRIDYRGSGQSMLSPELRSLMEAGNVRAVIICPSNPFLSIDPILAVPGLIDLLRGCGAPIVAVSPIVGGRALKGPTAKIMHELGMASDVLAIAGHYDGLIDGLIIDEQDRGSVASVEAMGIRATVTDTVMVTLEDRTQLARDVLEFADEVAQEQSYVGRRTG